MTTAEALRFADVNLIIAGKRQSGKRRRQHEQRDTASCYDGRLPLVGHQLRLDNCLSLTAHSRITSRRLLLLLFLLILVMMMIIAIGANLRKILRGLLHFEH